MEWIFRLTQYTIRPPEIFISKISHINKPIRVIGEGMHLLIIKKRKKKKLVCVSNVMALLFVAGHTAINRKWLTSLAVGTRMWIRRELFDV